MLLNKHKNRLLALSMLVVVTILSSPLVSPLVSQELPLTYHPSTDAYDGWRLGVQAYTFNRFTFFEAVDKTASLGLDWIEAYPRQRLSPEDSDVRFSHNMSTENREKVKRKLKEAGVKLINYGVVGLPNDEAESRKVFEFAKEMGIEVIVSEPDEEAMEMIDRLCQEYRIKVAIHNHPKPSHYWSPDVVLAAIEGRSEWIGANADTGHWMRSGVDPLEAIRKLEGRIINFHVKDLNEFGNPDAHDVIWGTGKLGLRELLTELDRQKYTGGFSIEYEYNWDNSLPDLRPSVAHFNEIAHSLNPSGWKDLVATDLSNMMFREGSWTFEEGVLIRQGGDNIYTNEDYGDYILDLEYMVSEDANSGVLLRVGNRRRYVQTSIEVQIHETADGSKLGMNGAIYDCLAPSQTVGKKANEWNHYTIICNDNMITVVLNGEQIIDMDLNNWSIAGVNPNGTSNKFRTALKDFVRVGGIGLQDHGAPLWFRNLKVRVLN